MDRVLSRAAASRPLWAGTGAVLGTLGVWLSLWGERRALERLDARMLRDIGVDDETAHHEATRPMWDVPRDRFPAAF